MSANCWMPLLVPALIIAVAATVDARCECFNGGGMTSVDPCTCVCPSGGGYLQPACAWTATEIGKIHIVVNATKGTDWSASVLDAGIRTVYSLLYEDAALQYQYVDDSSNDMTLEYPNNYVSRWLMQGALATRFLEELRNRRPELVALGIVAADVYKPDYARAGRASEAISFEVGDMGTLAAIWVIGLIIVLVCAIGECCIVTNTKDKCEKAQEADIEAARKKLEEQRAQDAAWATSPTGKQLSPAQSPSQSPITPQEDGGVTAINIDGNQGDDAMNASGSTHSTTPAGCEKTAAPSPRNGSVSPRSAQYQYSPREASPAQQGLMASEEEPQPPGLALDEPAPEDV